MIDPKHPRLSIVRQCQLASISRSSHYYVGKGGSPLNLGYQRGDQIVQPLSLGPFFEDDVSRAAHAAEELDHRRCFCGHDCASDDPSPFHAHRGNCACLMDVEPHILSAPLHESRSLLL